MTQQTLTVVSNRPLTASVYEMKLRGDTGDFTRPGQFLNLRLDGLYLRRPFSICDIVGDLITVIYKVVGRGTEAMTALPEDKELDALLGLGNGFDSQKSGGFPLLIGGGVGIPPLFGLAKTLIAEGKRPSVVLGFNRADEIFYEEEFRALGIPVTVTTADGSYGVRGFVTDALPKSYSYFYTCGPEPMLKAVYRAALTSGELSFEARMGCGFGACMGCSCKTVTGSKRICREGPVLEKEEILWQC